MVRVQLLFVVLVLASATSLGQEPDGDVRELRDRIAGMQSELDRRAAREAEMQQRIAALESAMVEQNRSVDAQVREAAETGITKRSELEALTERLTLVEHSPAAGSKLAVGGYFDIEYRSDQSRRTPFFDQHRFILKFDGEIHENISFRSEVELEGGGSGASFLSGNQIVVEYAEVRFRILDEIQIKAGALLVPFGRLNYLHDSPLQDLTDRPLVDQFIIPTTWTETGIGLFGFHDFDGFGVDWDIIVSNGLDDDFEANPGGGFRNSRSSYRADNNENKQITGRVGFTPEVPFLDVVNIGFSFGIGQYDDDDDQQITMIGLDWTLKKGPFELIGEYVDIDLERGPDQLGTGIPGGANGFYAQLNYHFFFDSWRGATPFFTDESTFTLVFRFGTANTDDSAHGIDRATRGDGFRDDVIQYVVGFNFRPIEKTVLKFEYQINTETGGIDHADNNRFVISIATSF